MSSDETKTTVELEAIGGDQVLSPPSGAKKSSTRARAEARRRRILEQGKSRLGVVSGEVTVEAVLSDKKQTNDNPDQNVAGKEGEEEEGESPGIDASQKQENAQEKVAALSKTSSSQRLAQMRRRRFKKAAAATKNEPESVSEEPVSQEAKELETKKELTPAPEPKEESKTDGKKYMGVVKMRRKMLAEKKASKEAATAGISHKPEKLVPEEFNDTNVETKSVAMLPIIFNLLTILILFLVGFDVGVQNSISNQTVPHIHRNLVLNDHGIGVLSVVGMSKKPSQSIDIIVEEQSFFSEEENEFEIFDDEETKGKPMGATESGKEENIDPLFGVDLDELTSGSGVIFSLARIAVSVHRMFLYVFFSVISFIKGIFTTVFTIPIRLMTNPPVMFLSAIIIRYVGKHTLGGKLPEFDDTGENAAKNDEVGKDVLAMGTNYVKNFFKSTFPNLVLVYTLFKDAKSDMYVILSGLFLGLAFPMNLIVTSTGRDGSEEL